MRAITITAPGGPEVLTIAEVPDPEPAAGEVVIEIAAAGVNRADLLQRQGLYPPPPGAPPYPGMECSGRISRLGSDVTGWKVGDEVCALLAGGGYAERVAVPAGQVLPVPEGISVIDAAALPEVACTVHSNVVSLAGLAPGETFLVHGGASGIGTMAIQLGRALGARVACTAGSAAKLDRCRELGADLAISYVERGLRRGGQRLHRRWRRRRHPRHHRRGLPAAERDRAGHRRPADGDRAAGRRPRRARSQCAAAQARPRARHHAPEQAGAREGSHRQRGAGAGLAAGRVRPDPAGDRDRPAARRG